MRAKLRHIAKNINPCGGIFFCMEILKRKKIPEIINSGLGSRVKQAKYSYSDVILSWIYSMLCGGERLEDTKQTALYFSDIPEYAHPSPDRIGGIFKELAPTLLKYNTTDYEHQFCIDKQMNLLSIRIAKRLGLLREFADGYTMDYDNIIIPCEKYDAGFSYKKCNSYAPGVAFIGSLPVYVEGRNGNSSPVYKMNETIRRAFDLLRSQNIGVKRFRSDSAAYSTNTFNLCKEYGVEFFIRANNSGKLFSAALDTGKWEKVRVGDTMMDATSVFYTIKDQEHRVVVTRIQTPGIMNEYTNDEYCYRGIVTNNWEMTAREVVHFYNQRGTMETYFTHLLNDWNWKRLPFSFLNQNTVFMIIGAIASIIYRYLLTKFSGKTSFVKTSFRLKNFIFHFISVALAWEDGIPIIYSTKDYSGCG